MHLHNRRIDKYLPERMVQFILFPFPFLYMILKRLFIGLMICVKMSLFCLSGLAPNNIFFKCQLIFDHFCLSCNCKEPSLSANHQRGRPEGKLFSTWKSVIGPRIRAVGEFLLAVGVCVLQNLYHYNYLTCHCAPPACQLFNLF